ncbi:MAG: hypothetical protein ACI8PT_001984 [Gammaproteobacteria bacterium]|jgi:hypothetical protein
MGSLIRASLCVLMGLGVWVVAPVVLSPSNTSGHHTAPTRVPPKANSLTSIFTSRLKSPQTQEQLFRWRAPSGTIHIGSSRPLGAVVGLDVFTFARTPPASPPTQAPREAGFGGSQINRTNVIPSTLEELMEDVEDTARKLDARTKLMQELARQL